MSRATPDARIEVLVAGLDGLLAGFVAEALESHPDIHVHRESAHSLSIVGAHTQPDVLITSLSTDAPEWRHREQFFGDTGVPMIAISADRTRAQVYHRWVVRDVELGQIVTAIRQVAGHHDGPDADKQTTSTR